MVRYGGTDWNAMMVPISALQWYRFERYDGTDWPILSIKLILYFRAITLIQNYNQALLQRNYRDIWSAFVMIGRQNGTKGPVLGQAANKEYAILPLLVYAHPECKHGTLVSFETLHSMTG